MNRTGSLPKQEFLSGARDTLPLILGALPFGLIYGADETFAVTAHRFQKNDSSDCKHWYQQGSSVAMYLNWQFWCFLGLILGNRIPDAQSWGLDVAMPVTFIGMIIPFVKTIPVAVCVLTAGAASLLTLAMPYKLGIVVSAFAGISSGLMAQGIMKAGKGALQR